MEHKCIELALILLEWSPDILCWLQVLFSFEFLYNLALTEAELDLLEQVLRQDSEAAIESSPNIILTP